MVTPSVHSVQQDSVDFMQTSHRGRLKGGKSVCGGYISGNYSWPASNGTARINELMSSPLFVLAQHSHSLPLQHSGSATVSNGPLAIYPASRSLSALPSGCAAERQYELLFIDDSISSDPQCVISTGGKTATMGSGRNTVHVIGTLCVSYFGSE